MKNPAEMSHVLEPLTWLLGGWKGEGSGGFPTHDPFEYINRMNFKIVADGFDNEPIIHFEEIGWVIEENKEVFKHWETGYFKPALNGRIEFYVCHNTGRVEVTYGSYTSVDFTNHSFSIIFDSDFIRNDEGTNIAIASQRVLTCNQNKINYRLAMSTTKVDQMTNHLESVLFPLKEVE